jgi:hypothetical protein
VGSFGVGYLGTCVMVLNLIRGSSREFNDLKRLGKLRLVVNGDGRRSVKGR